MAGELVDRMGAPAPRVLVDDDRAANACTIGYGRYHCLIVNSGLIEFLHPRSSRRSWSMRSRTSATGTWWSTAWPWRLGGC